MDLPKFVENYGYLAVFVGSFLEGETILALAGFAAFSGYLNFPTVVAVAIVGATLGDQFFFGLGHLSKGRVLQWFPSIRPGVDRVNGFLAKYDALTIVGVRFMYGLRIVGPIAIGLAHTTWRRFFIFNLIGAMIWAPIVAGAGYLLGHALLHVLEQMRGVEIVVLGVGAAALAAWGGVQIYRRWRG